MVNIVFFVSKMVKKKMYFVTSFNTQGVKPLFIFQ